MTTEIIREVKGAIEFVEGRPVIQLRYIAQWQERNASDVNKQVVRSPLSTEFKALHAIPTTYLGNNGQRTATYHVTLEGLLAMGLINQRGKDGVALIDAVVAEMNLANRQDKAVARIHDLETVVANQDIEAQEQSYQIETLRLALRSGKAFPNKHEKQLEHFASQAAIVYQSLQTSQDKNSRLQGEMVLLNAELDKTRTTLTSVRRQLRDANEKGAEQIMELKSELDKIKEKKQRKAPRKQQPKKARLIELNKKGAGKLERAADQLVKRLETLTIEKQNEVRGLMNDGKSLKKAFKVSGLDILTK